MTFSLTLDEMLDEEELRLSPMDGTAFDVETVAAFAAGLGPCFRDPALPGLTVFAPDAATRDALLERRRAHPEIPPPVTLLIEVSPPSVLLIPFNNGPLAAMSRAALEGLLATRPCRIVNGHGNPVEVAPPP